MAASNQICERSYPADNSRTCGRDLFIKGRRCQVPCIGHGPTSWFDAGAVIFRTAIAAVTPVQRIGIINAK